MVLISSLCIFSTALILQWVSRSSAFSFSVMFCKYKWKASYWDLPSAPCFSSFCLIHMHSAPFSFSTHHSFHCNPSFLLLASGAYHAVSSVSTVVLASSVPGPVFHFFLTVLHCLLGSVTNCLCFLPALLVRLTCPYTCCSFTSCLSCSSCWQASVSSPWVCSSVSNKAFFSLSFSSRTCTERESKRQV